MVIADLHAALALIRHVAVGTRDTRPCVHALVIHLKLRVLRLQCRRASLVVDPIFEASLVVIRERIIDLQPLLQGKVRRFSGPLK